MAGLVSPGNVIAVHGGVHACEQYSTKMLIVSKEEGQWVFVDGSNNVLLYGGVEGSVWDVETHETLTASLLC